MISIYKRMLSAMMLFAVVSIGCWLVFFPMAAHAAIKDPASFGGASWENAMEYALSSENGWLQSICSTDKYIVCLQDGKDGAPDTLIAFYKNNYDENNNPVQQFSFAKQMTEMDYEHGNGMTYNPKTNEIVIATGASIKYQENEGCIFVVDADTLTYKRTVKVSDEWNITGIGYSDYTKNYIVHASVSGDYNYFIIDSEFNILDMIESGPQSELYVYQDLCVSGDYILNISYDKEGELGDFIHVYSISQKSYIDSYSLEIFGDDLSKEPQSLCEIEPGRFLVGATIFEISSIRFYEGWVPVSYGISATAKHGTISGADIGLDEGTEKTVSYQPDKHYQLKKLVVNGEEVDINIYPEQYTFQNITADQEIEVIYKKSPKFKITTNVENGTISKSKKIYQNENGKFTYKPNPNYELAQLVVDGKAIDTKGHEEEYTFENVQEKHSLEVIFKEIPSYSIETKVHHGTIAGEIGKIYRDDSQTITYKADKNHVLFGVIVDGIYVDKELYQNQYAFNDIQKNHSIQVIYIWKYLIWCIGGVLVFAAWIIWYSQLLKRRRRRRIRK